MTCSYCGAALAVVDGAVTSAAGSPPAVSKRSDEPPRAREHGDGSFRPWGAESLLFFGAVAALAVTTSFFGWAVIGPHHDAYEAFALWLGLGPLILMTGGIFWDSRARRALSCLGVAGAVAFGFIAGMASWDGAFFFQVMRGSYLDDVLAYLGVVLAANIVGWLVGVSIHGAIARSMSARSG